MSGRFLRSKDTKGFNSQPLHLHSTSGAHSTPALFPDPRRQRRWPYKQQLPLGQGHWNKWMPPALPPLNKGLQQGCTQCWEQQALFLSGASLQAAATAGIWGTWAPGGNRSGLPKGRGMTCRVTQWQWTKGKFRPSIRQINCWGFQSSRIAWPSAPLLHRPHHLLCCLRSTPPSAPSTRRDIIVGLIQVLCLETHLKSRHTPA